MNPAPAPERPARFALHEWVGPLAVSTGVWCAAGELTVESMDASVRLAAPASAWWFLGAFGAAAMLPGLRARPAVALPALLPALPWLPVPLLPVFLVWTGYLAWVPVSLAVLAALQLDWKRPLPRWSTVRSASAAGLLTLLALVVAASAVATRVPSGDEPHYLIITQSLLRDGDLAIENNHVRGDLAPYLPAGSRPHYIRRGLSGEIYSIHAPGVAALVLPGFALFGYPGAQFTIVLLSALAGTCVWMLGWLATGSRGAAWFGWLSIVSSITFLIQGVTIFPDGPGAFIVSLSLITVALLGRGNAPRWLLVTSSASLSALPWLHSRFAVIAAGLGLVLVQQLIFNRTLLRKERWGRLGSFLLLPAGSALVWLFYFQKIYGTLNPSAPYGPNPEISPTYIPGGLAGLLFDQQFGLIACAPILAAGIVGMGLRPEGWSRRAVVGPALVAFAYLAASATYWMWWAGVPAPPARFAAPILPVLAVPIAMAWARSGPSGRVTMSGLLLISVAISGVLLSIEGGAMVWNTRNGYSQLLTWLGSAADLHRGWPSFFWALVPGDVRSEGTFARHVTSWIAVAAACTVVLATWRNQRPQFAALAGSWMIAPALMLAVQAGWWITPSSGLAPQQSQFAMLSELAAGRAAIRISPARASWVDAHSARMRIRVFDSRQPGAPSLVIPKIPGGAYEVEIRARRVAAGAITFRLGPHSGTVGRSVTLDPRTEQSIRLDFPDGERLTVDLDQAARASVSAIDLGPSRNPAGR